MLGITTDRVLSGSLALYELHTVFRRREAEGVLPIGESVALYRELHSDIAAGDLVIEPESANMEGEFDAVLEACFSQTPSIFARTTDALHLATAKTTGEIEFITADERQRAAALVLGF